MKKTKKIFALFLTTTLIVSLCSGCSSKDTSTPDEITTIQEALNEWDAVSELVNCSNTSGKEETVYVLLSADGAMEQTIVSDWLKNPDGSTSLTDKTSLSDITVVKGDAMYSNDVSGNQIVWTNNGSDIYYQGKADKELPVDVHISYELDGKKVTADELAGASGHLKITFTYTNHLSKKIVLQGKTQTIYQPFLMVSGMMLDNSKAFNVTVDHGNIINSGDNTVAFGVALPGLKESLGINDDIDIPDKVTMEADVTDFSLMMTLTLASNNALSQLGIDDMDSIDDLKSDMDKLTDGMNSIVDGTTQLNDGAVELRDRAASLSDGTQTLSNGASALTEGTKSLSDGTKQVNDGAISLKNGLNSLKENIPTLIQGVDALTKGADQLSSGFDTILENNNSLNAGASQIADGLSSLHSSLNNEDSRQQLQSLVSGSSTFSQGLSDVSGALSQIVDHYNYSSDTLSSLVENLTQYAQELSASDDPGNHEYAVSIQTMLNAYKDFYNNVEAAGYGINSLAASYSMIDSGIQTTANNVSTVSQAVENLSSGAGQLREGIASYTAGVTQASDAVKSLDNGLNSLNAQVPSFASGISQLSDGAAALASGTDSLSTGASSLANGAEKLNSGTSALNENVPKLLDGIAELANGTGSLKNGVIEYNNEGIQKLASILQNDLEAYYDRLKAIQEFAKEYTSYSGCDDNIDCSVKFIYKTDSIE